MTQSNPNNKPSPAGEQTDEQRDEKTTYYVQRDESVTEAVVRAVSSATQTEQMGLEPLYSKVDPDALNALFTPLESGVSRRADSVVAFDYAGNHVRITNDGGIQISGDA